MLHEYVYFSTYFPVFVHFIFITTPPPIWGAGSGIRLNSTPQYIPPAGDILVEHIVHGGLSGYDGLDHEVLDLLPDDLVVDPLRLKVPPQRLQRPFVALRYR